MPNLQKSIITFGAGLMSAWTELRLKRSARPGQEKAFRELRSALALTEQGRACGLTARTAYADFNRNTPLRTYENLLPQIERMKRGEADVLWPGQCHYYAVSSGTTAGRTKYLPITDDMVRHFSRAGLDSLYYYTQRTGHAGVFQGRHLFLGGATTLMPIAEAAPFEAWGGDLSGITALNLPPWVEKHLYEPGTDIAGMSDWPAKLRAIAERTLGRDITLIAGIPSWLLILAQTMREQAARKGLTPANLQAIWPNLECIVHGGVPIGPFLQELQQACGPTVNFHEVYPASEGFIAAQDAESSRGLRLMTDVGLFYEFLPLADYDETRLDQLGPKAVPLAGVKVGVDYVLLLTTPAGLCRYLIGDVVRFLSTKPPRLIYVGRTKLQLSAFGEHVIEKELTDALTKVCHGYDWRIVNFHVAPLFVNSLTGQQRGRHEWWIELRPGTVVTPTGPVLETALDAELQRLNDDYEAKRKGGGMEPPIVRLVMPGIFESWMRTKGKWGGQNKMPRCRSDRAIADELAQIARFTAE
ncbi:MAG: GH3 auxin-responsive promoter family protein [Cephaloticoccus sp.]|nr:GH3 auxin-responsive promoter family protein [Cephaloticoccus sp.]